MRTPSDPEIQAAAIELGVIKPGERMRPMQRAKVAKVIQIAQNESDEPDEADEADAAGFVQSITSTHAGLIEAGLPINAADRVVAAIAPMVWRDIHQ